MNLFKRILTSVVMLVLVGVVFVWPLVTGFALQGYFGVDLAAMSAPNRWSLRETDFQRGWFHSEAHSVLTLEGTLAKQMREARHVLDPRMPIQVQLIHHIQHGPVLSLERPFLIPAVALVETTLAFPQDTRDWLTPVFGQAPPVRVRSLLQLNGERISRIESPSVEGDLTDGTHLQWQGLGGTLDMTHDRVIGNLSMPLLALSNDAGQLRIQGLALQIDSQRHPEGLWLGDQAATLGGLSFMVPSQPEYRISLTDFRAVSVFREEQKTLHAMISMDLGDFSMGGHLLGSGGVTLDLRQVDLMAFSVLYHALQDSARQGVGNRAEALNQVKQIALQQLPALTQYLPAFGITRLDLRTPQGTLHGHLRILLTGASGTPVVSPADLVQRLRVESELDAPVVLLTDWMQKQVTKEMIAQGKLSGGLLEGDKLTQASRDTAEKRLSALVDQGLLVRYTDHYNVCADFTKGQLTVNDRPHNELLAPWQGMH